MASTKQPTKPAKTPLEEAKAALVAAEAKAKTDDKIVVPMQWTKPASTGVQHPIPDNVDPLLVTILAWPRKHESTTELEFRDWLWAWLKERSDDVTTIGPVEGQLKSMAFTILRADSKNKPTTLFSCHIDTVDSIVASGMRKKLTYDPTFGYIDLDEDSVGMSLGADDGVGVWIMLKMIDAKVPGTYIFHRGEECGGLSAKANAQHEQKWLQQFEVCVAFDRPDCHEIITHQRTRTECASDKFGKALAAQLNLHGFQYVTSTGGVYTDNFEYRKIIAECVNVGVGYQGQHGRSETLNYAHAFALSEAVIKVDWDALPVDRDPAKPDPIYTPDPSWYRNYQRDLYAGYDGYDTWKHEETKKAKKPAANNPLPDPLDDVMNATAEDLLWSCQEDPDVAKDTMVLLICEVARLRAEVSQLNKLLGVQ